MKIPYGAKKSGSGKVTAHGCGGMTLVEAIVYIALLSVLMANFVDYAYAVHLENMRLLDDINSAYEE